MGHLYCVNNVHTQPTSLSLLANYAAGWSINWEQNNQHAYNTDVVYTICVYVYVLGWLHTDG